MPSKRRFDCLSEPVCRPSFLQVPTISSALQDKLLQLRKARKLGSRQGRSGRAPTKRGVATRRLSPAQALQSLQSGPPHHKDILKIYHGYSHPTNYFQLWKQARCNLLTGEVRSQNPAAYSWLSVASTPSDQLSTEDFFKSLPIDTQTNVLTIMISNFSLGPIYSRAGGSRHLQSSSNKFIDCRNQRRTTLQNLPYDLRIEIICCLSCCNDLFNVVQTCKALAEPLQHHPLNAVNSIVPREYGELWGPIKQKLLVIFALLEDIDGPGKLQYVKTHFSDMISVRHVSILRKIYKGTLRALPFEGLTSPSDLKRKFNTKTRNKIIVYIQASFFDWSARSLAHSAQPYGVRLLKTLYEKNLAPCKASNEVLFLLLYSNRGFEGGQTTRVSAIEYFAEVEEQDRQRRRIEAN